MDKIIYEKEITVSVHDAGVMGEVKPSAIMQYFQDVATEHAAALGLGRDDLLPLNLFWVVSRLSAVVYREATIGEKLIVRTWPHRPTAAATDRDFSIIDERENIIIAGSSKWCVLSTVTHTPKRVSGLFKFDPDQYEESYAIGEGAADLPEKNLLNAEKKSFTVRNCELDTNFHMNNARYGDIIYNTIDPEFWKDYRLTRLDINFLRELKANASYDVFFSPSELNFEVFMGDTECARLSATVAKR